jgi:hypothetical protein
MLTFRAGECDYEGVVSYWPKEQDEETGDTPDENEGVNSEDEDPNNEDYEDDFEEELDPFKKVLVSFHPAYSIAELNDADVKKLRKILKKIVPLAKPVWDFAGFYLPTMLLGDPDPVQGDVEEDWESNSRMYMSKKTKKKSAPPRYRLLFQFAAGMISSEDWVGYFGIPQDALEKQKFDGKRIVYASQGT